MKTSQAGLNLIKLYEGLKLQAYQDSVGVWTIGYGSTYWPDGRRVKQGDRLASEKEAETLLRATVADFEKGVRDAVKVHITQNQFDAMVSMAFNIGLSAFRGSTLVKKLNQINVVDIANEFPKWNKAGGKVLSGLVRRRAAERDLFLK